MTTAITATYKQKLHSYLKSNLPADVGQLINLDNEPKKTPTPGIIHIRQYSKTVAREVNNGYESADVLHYLECAAPADNGALIRKLQQTVLPVLLTLFNGVSIYNSSADGHLRSDNAQVDDVGYNNDDSYYRIDLIISIRYEGKK